MEEKHFCTSKKVSKYRRRYDSEMNFDEYLDLYKRAPDPPILKFYWFYVDHQLIQSMNYLRSNLKRQPLMPKTMKKKNLRKNKKKYIG